MKRTKSVVSSSWLRVDHRILFGLVIEKLGAVSSQTLGSAALQDVVKEFFCNPLTSKSLSKGAVAAEVEKRLSKCESGEGTRLQQLLKWYSENGFESKAPRVEFKDGRSMKTNDSAIPSGIFVSSNPPLIKPIQRKFAFINDLQNDVTKVIKRAVQTLIQAHGGMVVSNNLLDSDDEEIFVINFGPINDAAIKVLETWTHKIYAPSLVFTSVEKLFFDDPEKHLIISNEDFFGNLDTKKTETLKESKVSKTQWAYYNKQDHGCTIEHIQVSTQTAPVVNLSYSCSNVDVSVSKPLKRPVIDDSGLGSVTADVQSQSTQTEEILLQLQKCVITSTMDEGLFIDRSFGKENYGILYQGLDEIMKLCFTSCIRHPFDVRMYAVLKMQSIHQSNNITVCAPGINAYAVLFEQNEQLRSFYAVASRFAQDIRRYVHSKEFDKVVEDFSLSVEFTDFLKRL